MNEETSSSRTTSPEQILSLALEAAEQAQPDAPVHNALHAHRTVPLTWTRESTGHFMSLLSRGNSYSWRFLEVNNILERALPEIAQVLHERRSDASELDPTLQIHTPVLEALRKKTAQMTPADQSLLLAALVADFSDSCDASPVLRRLVLDNSIADEARALLSASVLLLKASTTEPHEPDSRLLAQLVVLLGSPSMVERCRLLTEARGNLQDWQYAVLLEITTNCQALLAHPELLDGAEDSLLTVRRREALALTEDAYIAERLNTASPVYVLAYDADVLVRHAMLMSPPPIPRTVRVAVHNTAKENEWQVDIASHDTRGLLAHLCAVLTASGLNIINADVATWPDSVVLDTFLVSSHVRPNEIRLTTSIESVIGKKIARPRKSDAASLSFSLDNDAHPSHSVVTVRGTDHPGLIRDITAAFAKKKINVHHARISTTNGLVADRFEVSTRHGQKINDSLLQRTIALLA